jgi:predicted molibdopterin-dependent oxidoreductase YjgC
MVEAAGRDEVAAMYVVGENPFLDEANLGHARHAMRNLKFLVVQDIFMQETAQAADVVLPATSFAEKEGTFTNSERRVQRVHRALVPPSVGHGPMGDHGRHAPASVVGWAS